MQGAPARFVDLLLLRDALLFLFQPRRVVAFPGDAEPAVEFEDPAGDVVEEVPVVGDGDDGALVVLQVTFEPRNRFGVEVVGRFVEQEKIGFRQEQPAQRDAPALAAGKGFDRGVGRREAQRVHCDLELAVEVPRVQRFDLVLQLRLFGEQLVEVGVGVAHGRAHRLEPIEEVLRVRDTVGHVAEHVFVGVEFRFLGEETDAEPGRDPYLAAVAVVLAGHDPQQGRFARTVQPEHADLGARVHRDVDTAQDLFVGRVDPAQVAHRDDELGGHASTVPASTVVPRARTVRFDRNRESNPARRAQARKQEQ